MLFYVKRFLSLEIVVTLLLGGVGYWGIRHFHLPLVLKTTTQTVSFGVAARFGLRVGHFWSRAVTPLLRVRPMLVN
jgi:hypothetical protein